MTTLSTKISLLSLSLVALAACDVAEPEFGAGEVDDRCAYCSGGIKLNTSWLGSFEFGEFENAFMSWHNDTSLEAVKLNVLYKGNYYPITLQSVWAVDGQIFGKGDGQTYSGHQFDESVWSFKVMIEGDKVDVTVKIKSVTDNNGKDWKYVFKHNYKATDEYGNCLEKKDPKNQEGDDDDGECMVPICQDDPDMIGIQYDAIVTENITVDTVTGNIVKAAKPSMYWGCVSGAVGKAGSWGYRLDRIGHEVPAFQGAVRMVRADYCGIGYSMTEIGTEVSPSDVYGINGWAVATVDTEAIWGPDGALCVSHPRLDSEYANANDIKKVCEDLGGHIPKECDAGSDYSDWTDALFWTKVAP
jgi:hypothetical protein